MLKALQERAATTRIFNSPGASGSGAQQRPAGVTSPIAADAARTVGRSNPALVDLQHMRSSLNALQDEVIDHVEQFYADSAAPKSNAALGFSGSADAIRNMTAGEARTLQRRASFLLNSDAMARMLHLEENVGPDAGIIGHSMTTMAINAVACSVKSQTEQVKAVALQQAQRGERICPMTLQPANFQRMLDQNTRRLRQVVDACRLPVEAREKALKPLLEALAGAYFDHSRNSPGAPKSVPHKILVNMGDTGNSQFNVSLFGKKTVRLAIESAGIDRFCNAPLPAAEDCEDYETVFRAHLLEGFQNHPPEKKRAALYLQLLWSELGTVQEVMGMRSANKPKHGAAAQQAARRTLDELSYEGSHAFGDHTGSENDLHAQRRRITAGMEALPAVDFAFKERFGESMLTDNRVRNWIESTAYPFEMRMLRQPNSRLQLQAIPITGSALLQTPAFQSPT